MPCSPNHYRLGTADPVMMFELMVTSWCNYECAYCVATVHRHRDESQHAFDHHSVDRWVAAFTAVGHEYALLCRGGEPFLDHENFAPFLAAVGRLEKLRYVRVDTNGSWDPARYESVPDAVRRTTELNVSFHPTQISLERFESRLRRIVDSGWNVGMINYVMQADQASDYVKVRDHFRRGFGLYVNPNPDAYDGSWTSADPQVRERARRKLLPILPLPDLLQKTGATPRGKACFFPAISYFIAPNGMARRSCGVLVPGEKASLDFIRDSARAKPLTEAVTCPQRACLCLDRYAFLEELDGRGVEVDLLAEYVRDCEAHQARHARTLGGAAKRVWSALSSLVAPEQPSKTRTRRLPVVRDE
jgi:hypothetical protein